MFKAIFGGLFLLILIPVVLAVLSNWITAPDYLETNSQQETEVLSKAIPVGSSILEVRKTMEKARWRCAMIGDAIECFTRGVTGFSICSVDAYAKFPLKNEKTLGVYGEVINICL